MVSFFLFLLLCVIASYALCVNWLCLDDLPACSLGFLHYSRGPMTENEISKQGGIHRMAFEHQGQARRVQENNLAPMA
jgi:hypothetical protein